MKFLDSPLCTLCTQNKWFDITVNVIAQRKENVNKNIWSHKKESLEIMELFHPHSPATVGLLSYFSDLSSSNEWAHLRVQRFSCLFVGGMEKISTTTSKHSTQCWGSTGFPAWDTWRFARLYMVALNSCCTQFLPAKSCSPFGLPVPAPGTCLLSHKLTKLKDSYLRCPPLGSRVATMGGTDHPAAAPLVSCLDNVGLGCTM